jgi:NADH dehydrogenase [ubiquinone] 1 alpha subcomplex assembly factor 7
VNALGQRIAALIAAQGPMSVAEFMTLANGAYYAARDPFGAAGDFITAPEISQTFGEMLGLWCAQAWHDQGRPTRKRLVELGPGRGTLMADALRAARVMPGFVEGLDIVLVESSPALRKTQQEKLEPFGIPIRWAAQFDSSLSDRPLFLLANEFFDALPVRQFVKTARGWCERMVTLDSDGALAFALSPVPAPDSLIPADRSGAPDGGIYEVSAPAISLVEDIARAIAHLGGAALIIDYGYDSLGFGETLQAVSGHGFASILDSPGESDLSAHVDFVALAVAAREAGAAVFGPIAQGTFLDNLGIVRRTEQLVARNRHADLSLWSDVDRLINPEQMGTLFKVLAILPPSAVAPPGFQ